MRFHCLRVLALALGLSVALLTLRAPGARGADGRLRLLGEYSFESGRTFQGSVIGGLSGITYDPQRNVYYAVSDDRGEIQPARFFTLEIDTGPGGIGDVRVVGVTTLDSDAATPGIQPYPSGEIDAEEIVLTPERELLISSERDLQRRPWIRRFALDGTLLGELPMPERFIPESGTDAEGKSIQVRGVRNNLAFEGIALSPDGRTFYTANEEALAQDGPLATPDQGTVVRILRYDLGPGGWQPGAEVSYRTEPIFRAPEPPTAPADNGVSAMLWAGNLWSDTDLLMLERAFATGVGLDVRIFGVRLEGAQRTENLPALPAPFSGPVAGKTLLVRMADVGVVPDNLEGMTYGPRLPDGKPTLIVVSDDNFSTAGTVQVNQFVLFELNETLAAAGTPAPAPASGRARASPALQLPAALPRTGASVGLGAPLALGLGLLVSGFRLGRRGR